MSIDGGLADIVDAYELLSEAYFTLGGVYIASVFEVYLLGSWTDITSDVVDSGVSVQWGITSGNGPLDSVAGTGTCSFMLRNDAETGHPIGYYSPNHASCRAGWTFGVPFRMSIDYNGTRYVRFTGKVYSILPDSGIHERRQVAVTAYDYMRDLAEINLTDISIQVSQTESQVIANIITSLPAASQPVATSYDTGADTFPYALDTIGSSTRALSAIADVARSSFALVVCKSDGTFMVTNRHTRTLGAAVFEFSADFTDFQVPSDLSNVYNLARVVIHPKTIDAAATTVLYALTGTVPSIPPLGHLELWGTYNDATNAQKLIGGLSFVSPPVAYPTANYDYAGNAAIDGSGADLTGALNVVMVTFATTVKFAIDNTSATQTVYLIESGGTGPRLRVRGKGVYDRGPQTYQATSTQPYGTRPIDLDMPYQSDPNVGQSAADYVIASYKTLANQVTRMTFIANISDAHMVLALTVEPGNRILVTEPVTGIAGVTATVQSVSLSMTEKFIMMSLNLAPVSPFVSWLWGIAGKSEWGITTVYGF